MPVLHANGRCGLRLSPSHAVPLLRTARRGATLIVEGELDLGGAGTLADLLSDTTITTVDLANITFVDSSGLRVLLLAHRERLARRPSVPRLQFRAPSPPIKRLIGLSGLSGQLPISTAS